MLEVRLPDGTVVEVLATAGKTTVKDSSGHEYCVKVRTRRGVTEYQVEKT